MERTVRDAVGERGSYRLRAGGDLARLLGGTVATFVLPTHTPRLHSRDFPADICAGVLSNICARISIAEVCALVRAWK